MEITFARCHARAVGDGLYCYDMDEIRKIYGYNFRHNSTSVTRIMKELAMADAVRNFSDAPAPSNDTGYADAVDQVASHVRQLCFDDDTSEEGTAAAADGYSSDSSGETRSSRASKKTKSRGRSSSRRSGRARNGSGRWLSTLVS